MELSRVVVQRLLHFLIGYAGGLAALASVFGSNNKSNLATGVGGDGGVSILYSLVFHTDGVHEWAD